MENLLKLKSHNAPFNSTESVEDYFLSSSVSNVVWYMENYQETENNKLKENCDTDTNQEKLNFIQTTYYFQVLKRFSLSVAEQNNIPINDYEISFSLVRVEIPEFEDRKKLVDKGFVFPEKTLFESKKFSVVP